MIGLARRTLDDLWADLRFAGRTLLKTPGFLVAVVSLGLAVGACTAVYGTVDWLLNRPPTGVVEPDRVVGMMWAERGRENDSRARFSFSHPQYETLREVQDAFAEVAAYGKLALYAGGEGWGEELVFQFVSGTYFPLLGVRPHLGRLIRPEDNMDGAPPVVVLSWALWQSRFAGDPAVVGRPIRLQDGEGRIIGVMPEVYEGLNLDWNTPTDLWLPMHSAPAIGMEVMLRSPVTFFPILGRLEPGIDMGVATERAQRWVGALPEVRLSVIEPNAIHVAPLREFRISRRDEAWSFLGALLVVCGLILIAACTNVANFFFGRAAQRRREIALRTALGASRGRVLRQLGAEALLLAGATAAAAAAVGLAVATALAETPTLYLDLPTRGSTELSTAGAVDGRMFAWSVVAGSATALVLALLPMLAAFGHPMIAIKGDGSRWGWGRVRPTPRLGLLAFQVGLAVVLGVTAALYAQGFLRATDADPEYADPPTLLMARITPVEDHRADRTVFYRELLDRVRAQPWVTSAAYMYLHPYPGGIGRAALPDDPDHAIDVDGEPSTPGIFDVLGIPIIEGRGPDEGDGREEVIINRTLAERLWPGQDPIGKPMLASGELSRVVGVVARERCGDLLAEAKGCMWRPITNGIGTRTIYVRTVGEADAAAGPLRDLILEVDPDVQVLDVQSLETFLEGRIRAERLAALASSGLALFGILLLVLGCVSLFVSMVRDSIREIAIRMALGATDGRIMRTVLGHGLLVAAIGTALGVAVALVVTPRIGPQLYDVSPTDPTTFTSVPTLILLVAALSVAYAALTAIRSDPTEYLHSD